MLAHRMTHTDLVAPCGMNCGLCSAYLAFTYDIHEKGVRIPYCAGCRIREKNCAFIKKRCDKLRKKTLQYCFECEEFPCQNLQALDKRYRTYFRMSMIENLETMKREGMRKFLRQQKKKWACPTCGGTVCCHNGLCFHCDVGKLRKKKKLYRWE